MAHGKCPVMLLSTFMTLSYSLLLPSRTCSLLLIILELACALSLPACVSPGCHPSGTVSLRGWGVSECVGAAGPTAGRRWAQPCGGCFEGQGINPQVHLPRSIIRAVALYKPPDQHRNCLIKVDVQAWLVGKPLWLDFAEVGTKSPGW